jgi:hypothetical protein
MCILFSYISRRLNPDEFKLIILSNRDEYYHRPSKPANFINENNIYGKLILKCIKIGNIYCSLKLNKLIKALTLRPAKKVELGSDLVVWAKLQHYLILK